MFVFQISAWEEKCKAQEEAHTQKLREEHDKLIESGMSKRKAAQTIRQMPPPKPPARPKCDVPGHAQEEQLTDSGRETEMYFQQPKQILDFFTQLEEQNLFLIQNSQETEQALEELKQEFTATQLQMDVKTSTLRENIGELKAQIDEEEVKASQLSKSINASMGSKQGSQEEIIGALHKKVYDVYKRCGFDVNGGSPNTLFMLSELEARLEDLLTAIKSMPPDYVAAEEKRKDTLRRERKRQEMQEAMEKERIAKNERAMRAAFEAPPKRTGRQVMFRSAPVRRQVKEEVTEPNQDELDEIRFLSAD